MDVNRKRAHLIVKHQLGEGRFTERCLLSLRPPLVASEGHRITVVDGAGDYTQPRCLEVSVVELRPDLGPTLAFNRIIGLAPFEFFCCLDNTVVASPNWFERTLSFLRRTPSLGIAAPYTDAPNYAAPQRWDVAPDFSTTPRQEWELLAAVKAPSEPMDADVVDPRVWILTREAVALAGLPVPGPDMAANYCVAVRRAGLRVMIAPSFVHVGGASEVPA